MSRSTRASRAMRTMAMKWASSPLWWAFMPIRFANVMRLGITQLSNTPPRTTIKSIQFQRMSWCNSQRKRAPKILIRTRSSKTKINRNPFSMYGQRKNVGNSISMPITMVFKPMTAIMNAWNMWPFAHDRSEVAKSRMIFVMRIILVKRTHRTIPSMLLSFFTLTLRTHSRMPLVTVRMSSQFIQTFENWPQTKYRCFTMRFKISSTV
mmetsp:Transcript_61665/g.194404  ORF Transcript_61665/g.194404 Transcript_61665/m.194404 type:complete len:208 (-) Transcript_61665:785-1408(-)